MSREEQIFKIFNEIQSETNTKENMKSLYRLYESTNINEFIKILEDIFLIIFYNYDKNTCPLKNIKDFLKTFIDYTLKNQKLKNKNITFLNYFCNLFTKNGKKSKYKQLSVYFLCKSNLNFIFYLIF